MTKIITMLSAAAVVALAAAPAFYAYGALV